MILVTGATGYTGRFLLRRLSTSGRPVRCLVRPTSDWKELEQLGVEIRVGDLENPAQVRPAFCGVELVFHLAHIRYAPTVVGCVDDQTAQVVLVSSLRRFSRVPSLSVDQIVAGERCALQSGMRCTILRPSMIYGPGDDRNISRLAAYLRRCRWWPVFGSGRALQQPVYVGDVVEALLAAAQTAGAIGKQYAVAGPEAIPYNRLVELVGAAVGVTPVKVHLPVWLALTGLRVSAWCGVRWGLDAEQLRRLQEDHRCSIEVARADLGYRPLGFAEGLARIYGRGEGACC